ncbi:nitrate reductase molybdenum cofactor assembly chaperone [Mycolicibacterium mucogenicum]|uniref:Nitrate reductase molybdenum cofactor assembly chaperone n=1 Tax=Mycolicibacterium mucogenicum TaxID=56689 RepID=A0A1A0N423_MYCMU|nr:MULTISPECIES: nitrate reductase molybdenum cofactor assembly chaperone [Mycolicibacterium]OBA91783.1 nitrate reductase molybdenum cofactor assembly chaperone [Mycolicibacterium mucogenicum]RUP32093.1 MAG: nitrate reductase molybdenum cofactor assembly chaperone [Mycolicibacterium sp.]
MKLRARDRTLADRLVWQSASLLLTYPDQQWAQRLDTVDRLRAGITGQAAALLAESVAALRHADPAQAAYDYVETFDLHKRTTMYLTYWTAGDTRNRGSHMHAFVAAYHDAGVPAPKDEAPDHLPVVLEFAATVDPDAGRRLLAAHQVPMRVLLDALTARGSAYAPAVAAVCATLPVPTERDVQRAQRLTAGGAPAEAVGLEPFTLTVPPRRAAGGSR